MSPAASRRTWRARRAERRRVAASAGLVTHVTGGQHEAGRPVRPAQVAPQVTDGAGLPIGKGRVAFSPFRRRLRRTPPHGAREEARRGDARGRGRRGRRRHHRDRVAGDADRGIGASVSMSRATSSSSAGTWARSSRRNRSEARAAMSSGAWRSGSSARGGACEPGARGAMPRLFS